MGKDQWIRSHHADTRLLVPESAHHATALQGKGYAAHNTSYLADAGYALWCNRTLFASRKWMYVIVMYPLGLYCSEYFILRCTLK
jgi:hypothetical protein